eukprot:gb/GEZN01007097.1/.p1 GENE.gb/GEZN01007097.1/~~gb/GEZN01007097.1/.p1  ORF type:complete len:481 (+),score=62.67 gb/GEZN01007097.1/:31-1473(+)
MEDDEATLNAEKKYAVQGQNGKGKPPRRRVVQGLYMAFLTFFSISGGPFGMESCIRAAGPLVTLCFITVIPFVWAIPQILMTTELACHINDINGGYIVWVQRALGDFPAFINGWNSFFANGVDAAIPPVIVGEYCSNHFGLEEFETSIIKVSVLLICLALNLRGMELVGCASVALATVVLLPLLLFFVFSLPHMRVAQWEVFPPSVDWALFLSSILWLYSGFDDAGAIAAEVIFPVRTYTRGMYTALLLTFLCYLLPVLSALTRTPVGDYSKWHNGFFAIAASQEAKWLGLWVTIACVLSQMAQYNANLATDARVIWSMASGAGGSGPGSVKLPSFLSWEWRHSGTTVVPAAALLLQTAFVALAMRFSFKSLVQCDTIMNCITLLMEFVSFLYLKHYDLSPRVFSVPGGKLGAWLITVPKVVIIGTTFYLAEPAVLKTAAFFNCCFVCLYGLKSGCRYACTVASEGEAKPLLAVGTVGTV